MHLFDQHSFITDRIAFRCSGAYNRRTSTGRWIDQAAWAEAFKPIPNPRDGSLFFLPEESNDELFLRAVQDNCVWTDFDVNLDGSDVEFVVMPGRYDVDRVGHLVTRVPWTIYQADLVVVSTYTRGIR